MSDIGTAYVNIVPRSDGIKNTLTKQFSQDGKVAGLAGGKSLMAGLSRTVATAAAGLAVTAGAALVAGISAAVNEGAKLEQSMGGIQTLFKENADEVIKNAEQAYKTAGLSANAYMENVTSFSAALISSLGGDTQKAAKVADMAMVDMADNANKMGTDMTMIQNAYQSFARGQYQLLDNLKLGYGGTKEEMERLLEDAGKLSGQTYDISNLNDVYEAIHVIQQELGITGTTAEEAEHTLSGSFASMTASVHNLLGALFSGENIEDAMKNLISSVVTYFGGNLIPAIVNISKNIPKAISAGMTEISKLMPDDIGKALSNGLNTITEKLPSFLEKGRALAVKIGEGLIKKLPEALDGLGTALEKAVEFFEDNYPAIMEAGGKIVGKLAEALIKNAPQIIPAVLRLIARVTLALGKLPLIGLKAGLKFIKSVGSGIWNGVSGVVEKVKSFVDKVLSPIKGLVDKIKGYFPINIGKILSGIKLPHFSVSGGSAPWGIGGKGSMPKFSVSWYAKGGILTEPTLFGAGEAGDEAILPLDTFWKKLDQIGSNRPITNNWYVNGADDPEEWATIAARRLELEMNAR